MLFVTILVLETPCPLFPDDLANQQTNFSQVLASHADRMERLNKGEHFLELSQGMAGILRDLFQRSLEKPEVVHVADNQFRRFPLQFGHVGSVQLFSKMAVAKFPA